MCKKAHCLPNYALRGVDHGAVAMPWTCCLTMACKGCRARHKASPPPRDRCLGGRVRCPFCQAIDILCVGEEQVRWGHWARKGDAESMLNYGQAQMLGHGVPEDDASAFRFLRAAATQGHPRAMHLLARLLWEGRGGKGLGGELGDLSEGGGYDHASGRGGGGARDANVSVADKEEACRLLEAAAAAGYPLALPELAAAYASGVGGQPFARQQAALELFAARMQGGTGPASNGITLLTLLVVHLVKSEDLPGLLLPPNPSVAAHLVPSATPAQQARAMKAVGAAVQGAVKDPGAFGAKVSALVADRDARRWAGVVTYDPSVGWTGYVELHGTFMMRNLAKCRQICSSCKKFEAKLKCDSCANEFYCGPACQAERWKGGHSGLCRMMGLGKASGCEPGGSFGPEGYAGLNARFEGGANAVMLDHDMRCAMERQQPSRETVGEAMARESAKAGRKEARKAQPKGKGV
jgi:TPR repeat protein